MVLDTEVGPLGAPGHGGTAFGGRSTFLIDGELNGVADLAIVANQDLKKSKQMQYMVTKMQVIYHTIPQPCLET